MRAILTPDDLKKGEIITPGWHPAEIVGYEEKDADTDKSTNCIFNFKILDGPEKGKTANRLFNEKALGFGKNLWPVIGIPKTKEGGFELSSEVFRAAVGKKLMVYVKTSKSNKGNDFNDVQDYRPLQ